MRRGARKTREQELALSGYLMNDNVKKALSELERECPGYAWSLNVLRVRITELETERDDERDQRIVAEVDRDRAHGAREVLGKLLVERDALRAQVEALERERDMLQTALRDNSAAHSETGKMLLRAEAERDALRAWVSAVSEALGAIEPVSDCRVELSADAAAALAGTLRAQVEAARTYARQALDYGEDCDATDLLAAMDEAKP